MTAPTHIAFGLLTVAGSFSFFSMPLHHNLPAIAGTIIGSVLPDIDSPRSYIGRVLPFASIPIEKQWGHRTITHSLLCLLTLSVMIWPLLIWQIPCYAALILGYMSHIIADCATKSGVPLFYPYSAPCVFPGNAKYRIKTGSTGEGCLLIGLLLMLLIFLPILHMGGIWQSFRYLMATPSAAYANYRRADTETILTFEGRWRHTREHVRGEGVILDARPAMFWIVVNGQVQTCGEHGAILPDKVRVRETDRPVQIQKRQLKDETYEQLVNQIPENSLVSGQLKSSDTFSPGRETPNAITIAPRSLKFQFAQKENISRLQPILQNLSEREKNLSEEILRICEKLEISKRTYPPIHYLKLRRMEQELTEKKQKIEILKRAQVRFSGTLFIRILGDTF
ncbi:MAG: metal-dependent hydrolase [Gemmatimonadota bacterium]|nr:metal-dependent hydrolase [Gemmatimonadota bacterium]